MPGADERSTAPREDEVDLRHYLDVLRRRWKAIAVVVLIVVATAGGLSARQEPQYRAVSAVLIDRSSDSALSDSGATRTEKDAERLINNEVRLLESDSIVALVDAAYDGPINPAKVTASIKSDAADVITISVNWTEPAEAARLVNTYVEVFIDARRQQRVDELLATGEDVQTHIDELNDQITAVQAPLDAAETALAADPVNEILADRRDDVADRVDRDLPPLLSRRSLYQQQLESLQLSADAASSGSAQVLTEAKAVDTPVSPKPIRDGAIGLVLGLVLGIGVAFLLDSLDERIRSIADLERAAGGLITLALIPALDGKVASSFVACRDEPRSRTAEAYRSLRTSVKFASLNRPIKVIQVTSASEGEGKTTTIANLAVVLAQGGDRVAIVCCDLRRPSVHERFAQPLGPGFTDVLLGEASLSNTLRRVDPQLFVLSAGSPPPNPSELLSTQRASAVISALAEEFDVVLLDSTPVLTVTDALLVSRLVDATLVVVERRMTKRNALRRALQLLGQVNAPVLGLVLNGVPAGGDLGYGYGYGGEATPRGRRPWRRKPPEPVAERQPVPVGRP